MARVASFADIVKIAAMFIKTTFNDLKELKNQKLCIKVESVSAYLDVTEITNFWRKNADLSRTKGVCRMIYMFFGSSLGKIKLYQNSTLQDMCDRFQEGEGGLSPNP